MSRWSSCQCIFLRTYVPFVREGQARWAGGFAERVAAGAPGRRGRWAVPRHEGLRRRRPRPPPADRPVGPTSTVDGIASPPRQQHAHARDAWTGRDVLRRDRAKHTGMGAPGCVAPHRRPRPPRWARRQRSRAGGRRPARAGPPDAAPRVQGPCAAPSVPGGGAPAGGVASSSHARGAKREAVEAWNTVVAGVGVPVTGTPSPALDLWDRLGRRAPRRRRAQGRRGHSTLLPWVCTADPHQSTCSTVPAAAQPTRDGQDPARSTVAGRGQREWGQPVGQQYFNGSSDITRVRQLQLRAAPWSLLLVEKD